MKFIIKLAIKNVLRHTKRTLITSLLIAFGVALLIWMDSMLGWADVESILNLVKYETGHAKVYTEEFWNEKELKPIDKGFEYSEIAKKISAIKGVSAAPRIEFSGQLSNNEYSFPFIFTGISKDDKKITDRSEFSEYDYLVVMDETLLDDSSMRGLSSDGSIILNSSSVNNTNYVLKGQKIVSLDATSLALEILGLPITNTAMLGTLVGASGVVSLDSALNSINDEMKPSVADKNRKIVKKAYEMVRVSK